MKPLRKLLIAKLTAIIPTRGDVSQVEIRDRLERYSEIVEVQFVVSNSGPWVRYEAAEQANTEWVYTQDDDCLTDLSPLLCAVDEALLCAMKPQLRNEGGTISGTIFNCMRHEHWAQYSGAQTLLGFGAIFHKSLLRTLDGWERDDLYRREADRIFATVNPHVTVFPHIELLAWATADNRMYRQADHISSKNQINQRIFERTGIRA